MSERLLHVPGKRKPVTLTQVPQVVSNKLDYLLYRYVYEQPSKRYRQALAKAIGSSVFLKHARTLVQEGVLILSAYFSGAVLQVMQADFEAWSSTKSYDQNGLMHFDGAIGESYLKTSVALSRAAVDPYLTSLASYYWGKPVKLAYARGYRTEPIPPKEYRAFQWHHDLKRKQIKVMVLLTDVAPDGQRMDYIPQTHTIWHTFDSQLDTTFSSEEALRYGKPIPCIGPAGTVIIFDTNGLHRGNRNMGPRRDQYTFNYTAGKSVFPLPGLHPLVIRELTDRQKRVARIEEADSDWLTKSLKNVRHWYTDRFVLIDV